MSRTVPVAVVSALLGAALSWTFLSTAHAEPQVVAEPVVVQCAQLQQRPGQVDEAFVERFMASQIAQGRKRFESVTGVSTVLCAW